MKTHFNCLIVDDETELADMTKEYFELFGVTCDTAGEGTECIRKLSDHSYDILLLDINLQEESGFKLCKTIREQWNLPILFISARQSDEDILTALNIGGDDYVKKPYTLSILLAKVKAMLKRLELHADAVNTSSSPTSVITDCDGLHLEAATMKAYIDGREVQLKAKEFKLLQCLFEHKNTIVKKETLFDMVWGDHYFGDGTLNVHIRKLREKLEENPNEPRLIKTVWGTGYMLEIKTDENA